MPLVTLIGPGQGGDAPMLLPLLDQLRVSTAAGQVRTRPEAVMGDKAYSSKAIRAHLRSRKITAVIPEPDNQINNRLRRGSAGGRPPSFDPTAYRGRHVVECRFAKLKQWRALACRYDKLALTYRAAVVLHAVIAWTQRLSDTPEGNAQGWRRAVVGAIPGTCAQGVTRAGCAGDRGCSDTLAVLLRGPVP